MSYFIINYLGNYVFMEFYGIMETFTLIFCSMIFMLLTVVQHYELYIMLSLSTASGIFQISFYHSNQFLQKGKSMHQLAGFLLLWFTASGMVRAFHIGQTSQVSLL
jgi:hypothetical protein